MRSDYQLNMSNLPKYIGHYRVDSVIAAGSCGKVLKAYDNRLNRWVAIKCLYAFKEQNIENEARILAGLNHPNIVSVYELLIDEPNQYGALVMEYLPADNLSKRLLDKQPLPLIVALKYCLEIAQGLDAAHQVGIIHRDLKPDNIFIDCHDHLKIGDFGIAKSGDKVDDKKMFGSVSCCSPEQALGKELTIQSDLFSLGLLLYQMLTGHHPFERGDGDQQTLKRLVEQPFPPIALNNDLVNQLLTRLLAKTPTKRYQSSGGVIAKIEQILGVEYSKYSAPTITHDNPMLLNFRQAQQLRNKNIGLLIVFSIIMVSVLVTINLWPKPQKYIAILKPIVVNQSTNYDIPLIKSAIYDAATVALNQMDHHRLVAADEVKSLTHSSDNIAKILKITAADEVLMMELGCKDTVCAITFSRWHGSPTTLITQQTIKIPTDQLLFVSDYVKNYLLTFYQENKRLNSPVELISAINYRTLLTIKNDFELRRITTEQMIAQLIELNDLKCRYTMICKLLLDAYLRKHNIDRDPKWLVLANQLIMRAKSRSSRMFFQSAAVEIALVQREYEKAGHLLDQLEHNNYADDTVMSLRARWYFAQGFDAKGRSSMATLILQRPAAHHKFNYALMLYFSGQYQQSLGLLEQILSDIDDFIPAIELKADLLLLSGQWQQVIVIYNHLIALDVGSNPGTQSNIGLAYLMVKLPLKALKHFELAAQMAKNNPSVIINLADGQLLTGRNILARRNYQRVVELVKLVEDKSNDDYLALAIAYAQLGRPTMATNELLNVLKSNINDPFVLYSIGLVYLRSNDIDTAIDYLNQSLAAGLSINWFQLPWFDVLLDNKKFNPLKV